MKNFNKWTEFLYFSVFCVSFLHTINCYSSYERIPATVREEVDHFKSYLQRGLNPCNDFYSYSCGHYLKNTNRDYDGYLKTVPDLFNGKFHDQLKTLLRERRKNATAFERKAMQFYKICEDSIRNKTRIRQQLNDFVKTLSDSGWPMWKDTWRSEYFDWFKVITSLKLFDFKPIFDGRIEPYSHNTTGKTFVIDCSPQIGYNRMDEERDRYNYLKRYEDDLRKIFLDYGTSYSDASQYAKEVIEFEKGLQQIFGDWIYYNDENKHNEYEEYHYQKFKTEFVTGNVNWDNYFETVFGFHKLKGTYIVSVKGGRYLKTVFEYLSRTPSNVLANYFLATIASDTYELAHPTNKPDFCVHATSDAMNPVISYMYLHRYFNDHNEVDIYNILKALKISHLQIWRSLIPQGHDDVLLLEIFNKLEQMRIVFFSDHIDVLEYASSSYLGVDVDHWNFVKTFYRFLRHNNLRDMPKDYVRYLILSSALDTEPFYVEQKNAIVVPPAVLQQPYYHREWPKLFKYSKIGFLLSRNLAKAFDNVGRTLDQHGNKRDWWITRNDISLRIEENLIQKYSGYNYDGVQIDGRITMKENFADYFGIRGAFYAYLNEIVRKSPSDPIQVIPRTGLSTNQTFFVSYAQTFCEEHKKYEAGDSYNPNQLRVNGPLSLMEEFLAAFECQAENRLRSYIGGGNSGNQQYLEPGKQTEKSTVN